ELLDRVEVGLGVGADLLRGEVRVQPYREVGLGLLGEGEPAEPVAGRGRIGRPERRRERRPENGIGAGGRHRAEAVKVMDTPSGGKGKMQGKGAGARCGIQPWRANATHRASPAGRVAEL